MISIARTLGAPETVPAGKPAERASSGSYFVSRVALDVRDDVHHLAVALDEELIGDAHAADAGHTARIVAAEIEEHQMLGPLLRIGEQFLRERPVLGGGSRPAARARDGADRHDAIAHRTRISGEEQTIWKASKSIEVAEERRRVGPPQER